MAAVQVGPGARLREANCLSVDDPAMVIFHPKLSYEIITQIAMTARLFSQILS